MAGSGPVNKHVRRWLVSTAAICFVAVITLRISNASIAESSPMPPTLNESALQEGDIIFRTGRDVEARAVLSQGDATRFSHVGIVIRHGQELSVIHAVPESGTKPGGVIKERLADFIAPGNAQDAGAYRLAGADAAVRKKIASYAVTQIGLPFDRELNYHDGRAIYCTELVLKAMEAAGRNISSQIRAINVPLLDEPVYPPDYLRQSGVLLEILTPPASMNKIAAS